ncbi:MAG: exodeoxyribonuclease VII large subunit [Planctomycetota bacterium]|nr:exodeoxyribonuclease VII large subunit [Planctomycetota bacterium]
MARLPFNSQRVPSPAPSPTPASLAGSGGTGSPGKSPPSALSVAQVAAIIRGVIADHIPSKLRVVGEISNLSQRGHLFFSLKDAAATIRCVCFASAARKLGFDAADGMQVIATGRIDYYDAQGQVQLYVDSMEPVGQGVLEMRFKALCEELRRAGYFEEERKRPLPAMPSCVAVVTSRTGAALQDVINTAGRRWAGCRLLLRDVRVQGAAAAPEIAAAIEALSRDGTRLGVEAILLTRGGGSLEDLWAFNERIVADAIFKCRLPIVAAIGHETDVTVAELVADRRCSTPTQAAMVLVPDREALEQQVRQLRHRLSLVLRRRAQADAARVDAAARHPIFRRPERMLDAHRQRLDRLGERLKAELPRRLQRAEERLRSMGKQLEAVGPMNVLSRGYSYTLGPDGRVLVDAQQVRAGDRLTSVLAKGKVVSRVEGEGGVAASAAPTPAVPPVLRSPPVVKPKRKPRSSGDASGGLFDREGEA